MDATDTFQLIAIRRLASSGEAQAIRERAGLTINALAEACNMAHRTVQRWESGETRPSGASALRWGAFLTELARLEDDQ